MVYKFSVGNLELKQASVSKKAITSARDIGLDYNITSHNEYGPEGQITDQVTETEELTVTCSFLEGSFDTTLTIGAYYDVYLTLGGPDGSTGIALTLANCRITGYNMKSTQGEFVISELTFTHSGKLTDAPGSTPTVQTVQFGSVYIGDSASVDVNYDGNVVEYIIPTALGIGMMSTSYMGGGKLNITVKGYVKKATRLEVEQYLINLYTSLQTTKGTLTVTYGGTSYTITNCNFVNGAAGTVGAKYANFTLTFLKSAY